MKLKAWLKYLKIVLMKKYVNNLSKWWLKVSIEVLRINHKCHFLRSSLIVKFLLLSKIYRNLSTTNPNCFTISSGRGFYRNFIVFTTTFSNYFPKQWAASISIFESPIQIKLVKSFVKINLQQYRFFLGYFWTLLFSIDHNPQGTPPHKLILQI